MELVAAQWDDIEAMRLEKVQTTLRVPLVPGFHAHLAQHAEVWAARDGSHQVGYALVLREPHEDHDHVTLVEAYLTAPYRDRYEDLFDVVRDELEPRAYLTRTDDCTATAALIAQGLPMEASTALMIARAAVPPVDDPALALVPLDYAHLRPVHDLLVHLSGVQRAPTLTDLESEIDGDRLSVLIRSGEAVGVVVQEEDQGSRYRLFDIVAPHEVPETMVWALLTAGRRAEGDGRASAAVVDARDTRRYDVFRTAGYFTAATYLVFYDPVAGRPSVPAIDREALSEKIDSGVPFHLVDVMGEEHWKEGHLPGSTWIDFKSLARQARQRFKKDEPIVVYCNDYTWEASVIAADKLRQLGYTDVRDYEGGLDDWVRARLPLER